MPNTSGDASIVKKGGKPPATPPPRPTGQSAPPRPASEARSDAQAADDPGPLERIEELVTAITVAQEVIGNAGTCIVAELTLIPEDRSEVGPRPLAEACGIDPDEVEAVLERLAALGP